MKPFSIFNNPVSTTGDIFGIKTPNNITNSKGDKGTRVADSDKKSAPPKRPNSAGRGRPSSAGRVSKLKTAVAQAKPEEEDIYSSMPRFTLNSMTLFSIDCCI